MSAFRSIGDASQQNPTSPNEPDPLASPVAASTSSFVGRLRELDAIRGRIVAAARGHGGVIILSGEPGIGKTRLALEAAQLARRHQFAVVRSRVIEGDWQPEYQCWIDILSAAVEWLPVNGSPRHIPDWAPPLAPLVPAIASRYPDVPAFAPASGHEERFRICSAVARCLAQIARSQPLTLIVDDLQWADPESLRVLQYLASAAGSSRIVVILLVRDEELTTNATLGDAFGRLQREEGFQEIRLRGLDRAMTGQLISGLAHRPVPEAAADLVSNATDGNPFFALELARFLIDEHRIDRLDESATLPKLEDLRLPESLRHAIDRLLKRLHPDTETLLRLASICGETFDDAILAAATSFEEARLLDAIDLALAGQLIQPAPHAPGYYAFVHPLVQHALADSQAPSRRVRMYRGMAEALIAQDSRTPHPHATQIARFYHQSANLPGSEEGIPYAIAAASQARREYDAARAVRYYRIARDLGVTRPAADQAEILAMLVLAEVEAFQLEDALRTTSEALEAMREAGATLGEQAAFIATAVTALHDAGMPAEAWMPMLNYGLELTPPGDVQTWARLTLLIDRFEIIVEGVINGSRWLGSDARAVEIARSCGDEDLYARSLQPWDLWDREWTEALSARIRTWHKPSAIIRALTVSSADWLYHHGDFRKAQAEFEDLLDISARNFSTAGQAEAYVRLALIQIAFGNLDQAREYEQQARLFVSRLGPGHRLHASLWWVAALLAEYRDGDWEAIAGYFVPYVADPDIARGTIALDDAALAALALVRAGNPAGARQMLTTLASVVARVEPDLWLLNGTVGFAAAAVWELGASGLAPVFRDTARTLLQRGNGDFPCSSLTLAVARMSTLLDEHDTATRAFDRARLALEESGQQPQRAIVDFDQAIAIADHRRGSTSQAIDLMTRAIERFRELGMAPWVARGEAHLTRWAEATDRVDPDLGALSPREIEVLQLVARGMSDKQISDQMFVSPRTVHAHIRNMLAKTRTSNRTELSIWALERDLVSRGADPA